MNNIIDNIHLFKGNVLCICVEDGRILSRIKKNNSITLYELERIKKRKIFTRDKRISNKKGKSVKIKKFRKLFKKKSIDYTIIDLNNVYDYYKYIASNTIYLCKNKIYIYGNSDIIDSNSVAKKYLRYTKNITKIQNGTEYIVIVDCTDTKFSLIKEKFYIIVDTFHNLGDMISYILTS